ncbi:hypothetical protein ACFL1R_02320 [Candidatus Latescibacterota bacterium]
MAKLKQIFLEGVTVMKKRLFISSLIALIICFGCSSLLGSGSKRITGKWAGHTPDGAEIIMVFKKDMTMEVIMEGGETFSSNARYRVEYSAEPIAVDIFNFDSNQLSDITFKGIAEFKEDGTMMLQGNLGRSGESVSRPTSFTYEAVTYKRSEE